MVYLKKFKTYESNSPEYEGVLDKYLETQIIQAQETISDLTDEQKEEIKDFYTQKMQEFVANLLLLNSKQLLDLIFLYKKKIYLNYYK